MTSESENANSSSFVGIMLELVISLVVTNHSQTDGIGTMIVSQRQVVDTLLQPHKFGYPYLTSAFYKGVLISRATSRSRHITCRHKQSHFLVVALTVSS